MVPANKVVAIVVPIYKETISEYEKISLLQGSKIFTGYDVILVKPKGLDITQYKQFLSDISVIDFEDDFFSSVAGYNRLLISPHFYKEFYKKKYEYILIYQLDAFVFRRDLLLWCSMGLDYIGAPWINHSVVDNFRKDLLMSRYSFMKGLKRIVDFGRKDPPWVGNGGLSLRKVRKFYWVSIFLSPLINALGYDQWNEDLVWSLFVPKYFPFFRIATFDQAVQFSIESSPLVATSYLKTPTPFGIHGWYASQERLKFWEPFIKEAGYLISKDQI